MSIDNPESGFGSVPEFLVSALPWVTSSTANTDTQRWDLPKVSRTVTIRNLNPSGSILAIAWTKNGAKGTNRFVIPGNSSETFDVRVKEIHIIAVLGTPAYSLHAGLTMIPCRFMPQLSGTLDTGTPGWDGVG